MTRLERRLKLQVRQEGAAAVVEVRGSAGMTEAEKLRATLEELAGRKVPIIVLDLTDMDFISSAGLAAIITAHLRSRHHQGQIRLVNPQPSVRDLLETTRLTKLFPICATVQQALAP